MNARSDLLVALTLLARAKAPTRIVDELGFHSAGVVVVVECDAVVVQRPNVKSRVPFDHIARVERDDDGSTLWRREGSEAA